ncbi:MAG: glycosyltransferase [bacterium]
MPAKENLADVAVVAIGRNEGERLIACLNSVVGSVALTVYVDSGSTDDSIKTAKKLGAIVVKLDTTTPFTAARARNAGYLAALAHSPGLKFIQFVDGDCEVQPNWLIAARQHLMKHGNLAVVFGRRRERYPERSIYNEMCDIEWDVPPGNCKYCGGDIMIRTDALKKIGGYKEELIAGEEPEMCVRLRADGWYIEALPLEMTLHDANITKFSQWWRRVMRSGWAYAAGAHLHGAPPERHWVRQSLQGWVWVGFPMIALAVGLPTVGLAVLLICLIYPLQWLRLFTTLTGTFRQKVIVASAYTIGRFPEFIGQIKYWLDYLRNKRAHIIEYK